MVLYEVNLRVALELQQRYWEWLQSHIAEMLRLPGFVRAQVWHDQSADPTAEASPETVQYVVHYYLASESDLAHYFADHAPRMRAEGLARFGSAVQASRRVLSPVSS
jgi:hypothetical protein